MTRRIKVDKIGVRGKESTPMERQKRGFKGLCAVILLLCFGLSFIPARGEEAERPTITVESVTVDWEDEIVVPIRISGNPGICFALLSVEYSEELRLLEVQDAGLFSDPVFGNDLEANPYQLSWDDSLAAENNMANGILVTLRFALREGAGAGVYAVNVSYDEENIFNLDLQNVWFDTADGRIEILEDQSFPVIAVVIVAVVAVVALLMILLLGKKRKEAAGAGAAESVNAKE